MPAPQLRRGLPKMTDDERADMLRQRADQGRAQRRARDEEADRELQAAPDAPWLHGPKEGRNSYGKLVVRSTVKVPREAAAGMTRRRQPRTPNISPLAAVVHGPDPHEAGCAPTVRDPDPGEIADEEERRRGPVGARRVVGAVVHYSEAFPQPYREGFYAGTDSKGRILVKPLSNGAVLSIKSDRVKFLDEEAAGRRVAKTAARAAVAAVPTVGAILDAAAPVMRSSESTRIGRAVPRAEPPEKSAVWEEVCRRGACINCGKPPRSTISHEGSGAPVTPSTPKRGVRQKVRDTLGTALCWDPCHHWYTDTDQLPHPALSEAAGRVILRSRAESLALIHAAQECMLHDAYARLPQGWRIEAMSIGIARVPEDVLAAVLLGGPATTPAERALDEAIESAQDPL